MRPKQKRRLYRKLISLVLLLFFASLTCLCLLGAFYLVPKVFTSFTASAAPTAQLPAIEQDDTPEYTALSARIQRFLHIRQAVDSRLSREYYIPLSEIPPDLQHAIVAVEDNRFYSHCGIDPEGMLRAALVNLQYGDIEEGGSTITQQLVKNLFLTHEQSFGRKAEELLLALDMERHYSKDEILEMYLNTIYYGAGFYGIGPAAHGYFGKAPLDLQLPESAMLAGIPNAPTAYSPYNDFMLAKKRQVIVIDAMVRNGYIDERTAEAAKIKPLHLIQQSNP